MGYEDDYESEYFEFGKSRSQKKRESTFLQHIGEELTKLPKQVLETLNLPHDLLEAIEEWKNFSSHEAKRRQMQYIGKLMREIPAPEMLKKQLAEAQGGLNEGNRKLEELEKIRNSLLDESPTCREQALESLQASYPEANLAPLKKLIATTVAAENAPQRVKPFREIFRFLRKLER